MTVTELRIRLQELEADGHGDEIVFLDTNPNNLDTIGDIDLDADGVGAVIWEE